ncbi:class I SAM-dependent methyltransferase [Algoriphagus limi]|uniref:Class I SAM-dependent methyltransferase n=1 Tax=Algoriphagus limi TaxID=2975273 RepID=A0ABT2G0V8_9BACT|nr:class I SAM-dependent methyltransferase [Algoriphagus limi]MCS5488904.1 class I SAM-dependent methyltransferase [Algoriphagus limi]
MKSLRKHLQDFGFKTELSWSVDPTGKKEEKFHKALKQLLGPLRYDEYLILQESFAGPEDEEKMMKFIEGDESLFKLLLSAQIDISEGIFQEILSIVKELRIQPNRILELGGANGWACNYLMNHVFDQSQEVVVVDNFPNWKSVNPEIEIVSSDYFSFHSEKKFDFIFSILGYSTNNYTAFLEKAISLLSEDGYLILGLRISGEKKYQEALEAIYGSGCYVELLGCKRLKVGNEMFPILTIRKGDTSLSNNEMLFAIRKGYYNLEAPKRIIGFEAHFLLESMGSGKLLNEERRDWEDGTWLAMRYRDYNGVIFRLVENFANDLVIEFPIQEQMDLEQFLFEIQLQPDYFSRSL